MSFSKNDLSAWLALSFAPQIGPVQFNRIKEHIPELDAIFSADENQLKAWQFPEKAISSILHPNQKLIEKHLIWAEEKENHIICLDDPAYPAQLKQIYAPPPLLFVKGKPEALQTLQIAMVGSRNPSSSGKENAFLFGRELALHAITITSGLALGIDGASHEGALSVEGVCIAVMGTGLDRIYPSQHSQLAKSILKKGAWVSEFPLETSIKPENFPRRNRLISGLSKGVCIVEAAMQSGSLITAKYALEQGREVYAIPGSIHNPLAKGCHYLLKQGAKLVERASDLLEEIELTALPIPSQKKDTDEAMTEFLNYLDFEPVSFDALVLRSGFEPKKVAHLLSSAELKGLIYTERGGLYCRKLDESPA